MDEERAALFQGLDLEKKEVKSLKAISMDKFKAFREKLDFQNTRSI